MNRLRRIKVTTKIVVLVLVLQFATIAVYTFFSNQNEEKRERENIDKRLAVIAHAVNDFVLRDYHDRVLDENSISKEEYLDLLIRFSAFIDKTGVTYVYSFVKRGDEVLYTSNSATQKDLADKKYELYFTPYLSASKELLASFENRKPFYEVTDAEDGHLRTIFIPFVNKHGDTYLIGVDIKVKDLKAIYMQNRNHTLMLASIIFLLSGLVSILLIHFLLKRIVFIHKALQEFFDYLNKKTSDIPSIKLSNGDELGDMARLINDNVQVVAGNIDKDNELIYEITRISEEVKMGTFSSRIETEANNPALNDVKYILNDVLVNMQSVMLDLLGVLEEFSKQNYRGKLDDYTLDGEMGRLVQQMNIFSKNISDYMLKTAYDVLNLEKDSSFLNTYMAGLQDRFNSQLRELHQMKDILEEAKRFNHKNVNNSSELEKQGTYAQELLKKLRVMMKDLVDVKDPLQERQKLESSLIIEDIIKDISYSLEMISTEKGEIEKFLVQTAELMSSLGEDLKAYEKGILDGQNSIDQTQKVSNNLKELSERMRLYIENSDFTGKENINILMNYTDR